MQRPDWRVGHKLVHPFDSELGVGVVRAVDGRFLVVWFPGVDRELTLAAESGLRPLVLRPGQRGVLIESDETVEIAEARGDEYRLADGRVIADADLWPLIEAESPIDRLAHLEVDPLDSFRNRIAGLQLMRLREAGGLGSFLGGRIELFPHQLHTALRAVETDPVRWLLADEVGLGKTVEACLILSALVRTGRSSRALVIAPDTLAVQWLGELYRKFHQVFTLLDDERLESTAIEFGAEFNPFVAHRNAVVPFERLASDPGLLAHALESEPDLVVVDEAHRLCALDPADPMRALVRAADHALLLTATPLQSDLAGFHALLEMLHPDAFPSFAHFERAVAEGDAELPCTSAIRRQDLGGFEPRHPVPVDLPPASADPARDPRAAWIATSAQAWREAGEKALVFAHDVDAIEPLQSWLADQTGTDVALFHERMDLAQRDISLARFRESDAPLLLCSEAGAEGRNFQFCDRMVHYDLPDDPVQLEQRIGRLDRIGRDKPVEIVYFRCADATPDLAALYERLELFSTPAAGIDAALAGVEHAIGEARASGDALDIDALARDVAEARTGAARSAPRAFYPDAYDPSQAEDVLALVPRDLEERTRAFCIDAAEELGLRVVPKEGTARYYIEFSGGSSRPSGDKARAGEALHRDWESTLTRAQSLPGVGIGGLPGHGQEVRFLGTFDREEAIANQSLAFFASGQMLVEGLLLELEDGPRGRSALFELDVPGHSGAGLICLFKDGPDWTPVVVDMDGRLRPEWAEVVTGALPDAKPLGVPASGPSAEWTRGILELAAAAEESGTPGRIDAAAYFRFA